ncbi:MAG: aldose 1-epimerase family protein [Bacteroidia bacterium]|nr:aldose 1-epimerase family protein [Bacteroidia bacterium]
MIRIENDYLRIDVNPAGAELTGLYHKKRRTEYLWQAGKAWPKQSPVLFPVVGQLKENTYRYKGRSYTLPRHGFARERVFDLIEKKADQLRFRLSDDTESRKVYPFAFHFDILYTLHERELEVAYTIYNTGDDDLYFSVGAHPAFRLPFDVRETYEDYYLEFEKEEDALRWPLDQGLISSQAIPFFTGKKIPLTKALFANDALVFKNIRSEKIFLRSRKNEQGLLVKINRCPFLGLWAAKDADFLCIEPWQGIADSVNATGNIEEKEGIIRLLPGEKFTCSWGAGPL